MSNASEPKFNDSLQLYVGNMKAWIDARRGDGATDDEIKTDFLHVMSVVPEYHDLAESELRRLEIDKSPALVASEIRSWLDDQRAKGVTPDAIKRDFGPVWTLQESFDAASQLQARSVRPGAKTALKAGDVIQVGHAQWVARLDSETGAKVDLEGGDESWRAPNPKDLIVLLSKHRPPLLILRDIKRNLYYANKYGGNWHKFVECESLPTLLRSLSVEWRGVIRMVLNSAPPKARDPVQIVAQTNLNGLILGWRATDRCLVARQGPREEWIVVGKRGPLVQDPWLTRFLTSCGLLHLEPDLRKHNLRSLEDLSGATLDDLILPSFRVVLSNGKVMARQGLVAHVGDAVRLVREVRNWAGAFDDQSAVVPPGFTLVSGAVVSGLAPFAWCRPRGPWISEKDGDYFATTTGTSWVRVGRVRDPAPARDALERALSAAGVRHLYKTLVRHGFSSAEVSGSRTWNAWTETNVCGVCANRNCED